jgi:DNA repair protein RAD16
MERLAADSHCAGLKEDIELFGYQLQGVRWMQLHEREGHGGENDWQGGVLADDMGLGKTLQCLTAMALNPKPTLVLCPPKAKQSWKTDIRSKFKVGTFHVIDWHEKKEGIPSNGQL